MKSEDGKVLIEGFYDDVVPLNATEKDALAAMPNNDAELERELQFAKPEGGGKRLMELLQYPSLNIRGMRSAYVGEQAQNVVPEKATAALDVRLVKGEEPGQEIRTGTAAHPQTRILHDRRRSDKRRTARPSIHRSRRQKIRGIIRPRAPQWSCPSRKR